MGMIEDWISGITMQIILMAILIIHESNTLILVIQFYECVRFQYISLRTVEVNILYSSVQKSWMLLVKRLSLSIHVYPTISDITQIYKMTKILSLNHA